MAAFFFVVARWIRSSRALEWVGRNSFAIYVAHIVVIKVLDDDCDQGLLTTGGRDSDAARPLVLGDYVLRPVAVLPVPGAEPGHAFGEGHLGAASRAAAWPC